MKINVLISQSKYDDSSKGMEVIIDKEILIEANKGKVDQAIQDVAEEKEKDDGERE